MPRELRIDPHVKVLDRAVVERAKARGLDALVYAPHFTRLPEIRERAARFSDDELLVVPGREVFAGSWRERKHVLGVGLTEPVPDFIGLEAAIDEFASQDAVVLVPHPDFATVSLDEADVERYRERIAAVEVYNPKHLPGHNRNARRIADRHDLPAFGSSYAHLRGTVGEVWTTFEGVEPTEEAVVAALRSDGPRRVERRRGRPHRLRCAAEFGHLFYENSAEKLYKLWRGPKPTNPYHPAYGGRFGDAAVYPRSVHRGGRR